MCLTAFSSTVTVSGILHAETEIDPFYVTQVNWSIDNLKMSIIAVLTYTMQCKRLHRLWDVFIIWCNFVLDCKTVEIPSILGNMGWHWAHLLVCMWSQQIKVTTRWRKSVGEYACTSWFSMWDNREAVQHVWHTVVYHEVCIVDVRKWRQSKMCCTYS